MASEPVTEWPLAKSILAFSAEPARAPGGLPVSGLDRPVDYSGVAFNVLVSMCYMVESCPYGSSPCPSIFSQVFWQAGGPVALRRWAAVKCRMRIRSRVIGMSSSRKVQPQGWG
eukprot:5713755-Prymnesium_polylepis.3